MARYGAVVNYANSRSLATRVERPTLTVTHSLQLNSLGSFRAALSGLSDDFAPYWTSHLVQFSAPPDPARQVTSSLGLHAVSVADRLSLARLVGAPLLLLTAVWGTPPLFAAVMACGLATDALDGAIARATGTVSARGARLDSRADLVFYSAVLIGLPVVMPANLRSEWETAVVVVAAYAVPIIVGWLKFGRLTAYHTWLARVSLGGLSAGLLWWMVSGTAWLLQAATAVFVLSAAEEILLTLLLDSARDNVPHVFAILPHPLTRFTQCLPRLRRRPRTARVTRSRLHLFP